MADTTITRPSYYGGEQNPYEPIKVIEAWGLGFNLATALKYIARAGLKPGEDYTKDLSKCAWYLRREAQNCANPEQQTFLLEAARYVDQQIQSRNGSDLVETEYAIRANSQGFFLGRAVSLESADGSPDIARDHQNRYWIRLSPYKTTTEAVEDYAKMLDIPFNPYPKHAGD